jgi:hypothetical protein
MLRFKQFIREQGSSSFGKTSTELNPEKMPDTASPMRKAARNLIPGLGAYDAASRHDYENMGGSQGGYVGAVAGKLLSGVPKDYYKDKPDPNSIGNVFHTPGVGQAQAATPQTSTPETQPKDKPKLDSIAAGTSSEPPQTTKKTDQFGPIDKIRSNYSKWVNPQVKPWNLSPSVPMNQVAPKMPSKPLDKYTNP